MQRNFSEIATLLDERMTNLEDQYSELKKIVKQVSIQNYIVNPALLVHWILVIWSSNTVHGQP